MARRVVCPACSKSVAVNIHGRVMKHGRHRDPTTGFPKGDLCAGTDQQVLEDRRPQESKNE